MFMASECSYASPRIYADCSRRWTVSVNTVADSMTRQSLQGRKPKHSRGLTKQDSNAPKFPDLVDRDFCAAAANVTWCGDMTEIPTDEGKLYMATVLHLFSRKLPARPTSEHPNADLARDAITIAAAVRGARAHDDGVLPQRPVLDLHRIAFHGAVPGQTRDPPAVPAHPARRYLTRSSRARSGSDGMT